MIEHSTIASPAWDVWRPSDAEPWDVRRVVHLHRRAGFAATWNEIQRDLNEGPEAAVGRLLGGNARIDGVPDDFERLAEMIGDAAVGANNVNRLKAWWLYRMLFTPDPLPERLTLMWHNHFATSNLKVDDLRLMSQQNRIFREHARGPFGELLTRVVKDPAMLVWLDAESNRKEHPNENLAREIMELFTLGVGNYTERDVKEAARALTGWSVNNGRFRFVPEYHDDGEKTILGQTGPMNGDDLLQLLIEHPATSLRLARRICELLMGERVVEEPAVQELAATLRADDLHVGRGVERVLRSRAFFSDENIGNRVLAPVEFIAGAVRALELLDPPPSTIILAEWAARLGQDLFYPPNVFGWPGGRAWMTSRALIGRANFATALVAGGLHHPAEPFNAGALAARHDCCNAAETIRFYARLLLGRTEVADTFLEAIPQPERESARTVEPIRGVVAEMLASPLAQLA